MKKIVFLLGMMFALMFCPLKVFAAESHIYHQHNSACYVEQGVLCTDEKVMSVETQEFYCNTCQMNRAARVVIERYSCKYTNYVREARRSAYCYTCNSVVMYQEGTGKEQHSRPAQVCMCGLTESSIEATVKLEANTSQWTSDEVVLTATVVSQQGSSVLPPYTYQFSGEGCVSNENMCSVSQNGTYTVAVKTSDGRSTSVSIDVANIDREAPVINKCYVNKEYPWYEPADIVVESIDKGSGLADAPYSFDGGKTFVSSALFTISKNGVYEVVVKDKVGNVAKATVTVHCFAVKPSDTLKQEEAKDQSVEIKNPTTTTQNSIKETSVDNSQSEKPKVVKKVWVEENDLVKEQLIQLLQQSKNYVPVEKVPGVHSSYLKYQAEMHAVPTFIGTKRVESEAAYSLAENREVEVLNYDLLENKNQAENISFSHLSKNVVAGSVLLCIGIVSILFVFLAKRL